MQSLVLTTPPENLISKINLKNLVQAARLTHTNFTKKISGKFLEMQSTPPIYTK